jgi:hypothetical protein
VGWDGWDMQLIWVKREGGNFLNEDWTTQITLIAKEIFSFFVMYGRPPVGKDFFGVSAK